MTRARPPRTVVGTIHTERAVPHAPPDRGPLVYDKDIAARYFDGLPGVKNKVRWIRQNLPAASKVTIGRQSAWYERDILMYLDSLRGAKTRRRS